MTGKSGTCTPPCQSPLRVGRGFGGGQGPQAPALPQDVSFLANCTINKLLRRQETAPGRAASGDSAVFPPFSLPAA